MARIGKYGILNVVVHPHPKGAYRRMFEVAGADTNGVRFHGDRFATLSPVSETRNGVFSGRLATWTEIDPKSNLIEKKSLKETLLSDSGIGLPDGVGFNSRVFAFAFRESDHQLYIELLNDEGQSISIGRAKLAFSKIFQSLDLGEISEVSVYVATRSNAVDQVLGMSKIRKVEIVLDLPNPDDLSDDKKEILKEIEEMHARQVKSTITKAAGEATLELSERYRAMAELAKDNGYVRATGRDDQGESIDRSTREYPSEIEATLAEDESRAMATRRLAERDQDQGV